MVRQQLNLFNRPTLNILRDVKEQMAEAHRASGMSRDELCDLMNDLADRYGIRLLKGNGKKLSLATLDKWLNPQDKEHYPSPNAMEVFLSATNNEGPLRAMAEPLGFMVIGEEDVRLLAWAKHYFQAKDARKNMKKIEAEL